MRCRCGKPVEVQDREVFCPGGCIRLIQDDCQNVAQHLGENSVDAVVTDPPYGLGVVKDLPALLTSWIKGQAGDHAVGSGGFMNRAWDRCVPPPTTWKEILGVLKPGGHLLAFAGTRTQDLMGIAIRLSGAELRDEISYFGSVHWIQGQGFPKGSAQLKPAHEPILMFRKELDGTLAENIDRYGTGGLNIDGGRIDSGGIHSSSKRAGHGAGRKTANVGAPAYGQGVGGIISAPHVLGRWPPNVVLSEEAADLLDSQAGIRTSGTGSVKKETAMGFQGNAFGKESRPAGTPMICYGDTGPVSRFFYVAKPSRREREVGLDGIEIVLVEYTTWDGEDRKVRLRVDTEQLPPKVISVSGIYDSNVIEWNMFLFGKKSTGPSLLDINSIIATKTNSITESRTLNWLVHLLINEGMVDVKYVEQNGGSLVESAEYFIPQVTITSAKTESPHGAGLAASIMQLTINGNAGSPSNHPTIKPIALMRYLCRLVTPAKGLILDPFMGSGTTGIAAFDQGFRFIGFENDPASFEIAKRRIFLTDQEQKKETDPPWLF